MFQFEKKQKYWMMNCILKVAVVILTFLNSGYGFVSLSPKLRLQYRGLTETHHIYHLPSTTKVTSTIQIRTNENNCHFYDDDDDRIRKSNNILLEPQNDNDDEQVTCRIAASADGKLILPQNINVTGSSILIREQMDQIYNAEFYKLFKALSLEIHKDSFDSEDDSDTERNFKATSSTITNHALELRRSLEQSGFRLWKQRDLDLCEALNEGYLLRLSIQPDIKELDSNLGRELYPDLYQNRTDEKSSTQNNSPLLYDGRILVFTRGYSQEITSGRLLLSKLDYLQSSIVQRLALEIARSVGEMEARITRSFQQQLGMIERSVQEYMNHTKSIMPPATRPLLNKGVELFDNKRKKRRMNDSSNLTQQQLKLKLGRYAVNSAKVMDFSNNVDTLSAFLVCEKEDRNMKPLTQDEEKNLVVHKLQESYENEKVTCRYDLLHSIKGPIHLLKRVSVANLIGVSSYGGRRRWIQSLFSTSKLIEPTYEEVCIIWRPLPKKRRKEYEKSRTNIQKIVYYLAELFDFVELLPLKDKKAQYPNPMPIEIRMFDGVPMANLQAVFPKTKLIFRPADALILDAVNTMSLLAVLASQRFDSPKLDLLALISVSLWIIRTFFRYSNKIARYDLLVNRFLTSRISHRNRGALQYILNEAATQRSQRASLVFEWLQEKCHTDGMSLIPRDTLILIGQKELNSRLRMDQPVNIDVDAALSDLSVLDLIKFNDKGELSDVRSGSHAHKALLKTWNRCFEQ